MKKLMIAAAGAVAIGFSAAAADWFNAKISTYTEWPTNNVAEFGGTWTNTDKTTLDAGALAVTAETNAPLTFTATDAKSIGEGKSATFTSTMTFTPFPADEKPIVPEGAKAALIVVKDGDTLTYWGLEAPADKAPMEWKSLDIDADIEQPVTVSIRFYNNTDGFDVAEYTIGGADPVACYLTAATGNEVSAACYAGDGTVSALSGTFEGETGVIFTIADVTGATKVVTVDGEEVEAPYSGAAGAALVVTYTAEGGKLFKNGTDTYTYTGVVAAGAIDTDVANQGLKNADAEIGDTLYYTLKAANDAAKDNDVITLLANASGDGIFVTKNDVMFNFNGKTYTVTGNPVGSAGTESQGFHIEAESCTLKGGTLTSTSGSGVKMLVQNYSDLTIDSMTLDGTNLDVCFETGDYVLSNNAGDIEIIDSTINAKPGDFAFDSCKYATYDAPTVTVRDSKINGKIEVTGGKVVLNNGADITGPENGKDFDGKAVVTVDGETSVLEFNAGSINAYGDDDCGMYGVYVCNGGKATFGDKEGGEPSVNSWFAAIGANNTKAPVTITVNAGYFTQAAKPDEDGAWWSYFCAAIYAPAGGTYTIDGGDFNGALYALSTPYANVDQTITINGGTFNGDPIFVGDATGVASEGTRTITKKSTLTIDVLPEDTYFWYNDTTLGKAPEAKVVYSGKTLAYYPTLQEAIDACSYQSVYLCKDITTADPKPYTIASGKDVTIDFDGYTVEKTVANDYTFDIENGAKVTFKSERDGTGGVKQVQTAKNPINPASMIRNKGTLTITGGIYTSDFCIIKNDEDPGTGNLTVVNGTFNVVPAAEGFTDRQWALMNWGKATIQDGIWNGVIGTRSCDRNSVSKAGVTEIGDLKGNPSYLLYVGYTGDTTWANMPKITGGYLEIEDVTLDKNPSVTDKLELIETSEGITVKATPVYTVTFSTNTVDVVEAKLTGIVKGTALTAEQVPAFTGGAWDVDPVGAVITCNTNFNYTIQTVTPIAPGEKQDLPVAPTASEEEAQAAADKVPVEIKDTAAATAGQADVVKQVAVYDTVNSKWTVEVQINTDAQKYVEPEEANETVATKLADAAKAAGATEVVIPAADFTPGLYYTVIGASELGFTDFVAGSTVLATGDSITLTIPKVTGSADKAFFKVVQSMTSTPPNAK